MKAWANGVGWLRVASAFSVAAALLGLSLVDGATAGTIDTIATGEAASREGALVAAQRHAVEQVVGTSLGASTHVRNLRSIETTVFAAATGFIESYEVVSEEEQPGGGFKLTIAAKVSQEKLSSALSPLVGGGVVPMDGRAALKAAMVELRDQRAVERALKGWLDELLGPAVVYEFAAPQVKTGTSDPTHVTVVLNDFKASLQPDWYERYRRFHGQLLGHPRSKEILEHAYSYTAWGGTGGRIIVEFLNEEGESIWVSDLGLTLSSGNELWGRDALTPLPPTLELPATVELRQVPLNVYKGSSSLRVRALWGYPTELGAKFRFERSTWPVKI
jgi:hypothetical protein